jgi:hypothetical protein
MIRLPISGLEVRWRPACGNQDLALAEGPAGLAGAIAFLQAGLEDSHGAPLDAAQLPVGDLDLLVVVHRRELLGDGFVAEDTCASCSARVDVHFSLTDFAAHHRPRGARAAAPAAEPGWWRLRSADVSFRLPRAGDVLAVAGSSNARQSLEQRCVRGTLDARIRRLVDRAMRALGPTLRADVAGRCPDCCADVLLDVDARELCIAELRFLASAVFDDVHLIASAYGWSEATVLDLPSARRRRYADLIGGRTASDELVSVG